jgi:hypothetical protein
MLGTMITVATIGVSTAICEKLFFDDDEKAKTVLRTGVGVISGVLIIRYAFRIIRELKSLGL